MSLADTIDAVAASNPAAGVAVAQQGIGSAILAGLSTGDTSTASLLGAAGSEASEVATLLSSLQPGLGQNFHATV